jgi:hypothetical protein
MAICGKKVTWPLNASYRHALHLVEGNLILPPRPFHRISRTQPIVEHQQTGFSAQLAPVRVKEGWPMTKKLRLDELPMPGSIYELIKGVEARAQAREHLARLLVDDEPLTGEDPFDDGEPCCLRHVTFLDATPRPLGAWALAAPVPAHDLARSGW